MVNILSSEAYNNPELSKQIYKPTIVKSALNINTMVIKPRSWFEFCFCCFYTKY